MGIFKGSGNEVNQLCRNIGKNMFNVSEKAIDQVLYWLNSITNLITFPWPL